MVLFTFSTAMLSIVSFFRFGLNMKKITGIHSFNNSAQISIATNYSLKDSENTQQCYISQHIRTIRLIDSHYNSPHVSAVCLIISGNNKTTAV